MKKMILLALAGWAHLCAYAQENSDTLRNQRQVLDSLFIEEVENPKVSLKPKVLHAEPLYIDLIRDLGARKGEKEWNIAVGMQDMRKYDEFQALIEYEWAPVDRLGMEVELPLSLFSFRDGSRESTTPANRLESLKVATQYTFLVSEKTSTSLALGYIHEFELVDLNKMGGDGIFKGNIFNPFLVVAKRWGSNYHTLIYTGPKIEKAYGEKANFGFEVNYNLHYMVSGTRNFIGMEINQEIHGGRSNTTLRPQMRVGLAHNLMIGIVSAIPISQPDAGLGSFLRIIYEPGFKALH
jgi:hypothetical protein